MNKKCFMFGHHDTPHYLFDSLEQAVLGAYRRGIRQFIVGTRGAFDHLAAAAVNKVKRYHDDISLYILLSYHPSENHIYSNINCDGFIYPPLENVPRKYAIVRANHYIVETCDYIICFVFHSGNTMTLLKKSKARGIPIINLGTQENQHISKNEYRP